MSCTVDVLKNQETIVCDIIREAHEKCRTLHSEKYHLGSFYRKKFKWIFFQKYFTSLIYCEISHSTRAGYISFAFHLSVEKTHSATVQRNLQD